MGDDATGGSGASVQDATPMYASGEDITSLQALTAARQRLLSAREFNTFRPSYHVQAPYGWMSDPCAPGFVPSMQPNGEHRGDARGFYHLFFEWNPLDSEWGNMSWGHYLSEDMVQWRLPDNVEARALPELVIKPEDSKQYPEDCKGIFSGCMRPGLPSDAAPQSTSNTTLLTLIYTAASSLPIHYTLPYTRGCEKVVLATSSDGGRTWQRYNGGRPVQGAEAPPEGLDVTGWRDPYVAEWEDMRAILASSLPSTGGDNQLFGILAGGIRGITPTVFLYSLSEGLTRWTYRGTLLRPGLHARLGTRTGDLGINFEVCNFASLRHATGTQLYLLLSAEGTQPTPWSRRPATAQSKCHLQKPDRSSSHECASVNPRPNRRLMWIACDVQRNAATDELLKMRACAALDYGCLYAANSFLDSCTQQRVLWGWIPEEDVGEEGRAAQGWAGCLSLPRELFDHVTYNVVGSLFAEPLEETGLLQYDSSSGIARLLGIRPARQAVGLRDNSQSHALQMAEVDTKCDTQLLAFDAETLSVLAYPIFDGAKIGTAWEFTTTVCLDESFSSVVGLAIHHSDQQYTLISFDRETSVLSVIRTHSHVPRSSGETATNTDSDSGPLPVFKIKDADTGKTVIEPLTLRLYFDKSVLEVFANDRLAISTRVYCRSQQHRLSLFAASHTKFTDTMLWNSLRAWKQTADHA
ncbi:glycoside hydrolase family 32 protein [Tilletiaria anomala UBC 951]|uniref:Glycoside hydrolase family 32 protein n=1 Tax=Tilletiaria anomala (strain ATCC 24038 / CBS 436.72 / UBC 951) TaxID=1037660 RepID=A0A066VTE7_TILAU|nr:glycoside hydrolase family 32 protein [Tilletiaria anomala UBC 951]KDN43548.1 glycoside hydrolase family 32 protein [Tilletiaria anomala UBC 951]